MIPKSINILGYKVEITVGKMDDGEEGEFKCKGGKYYIRINEDTKYNKKRVLLHEVIHGIYEIGAIGETMTDEQEESHTKGIENGLWPLLNSGLFDDRKS